MAEVDAADESTSQRPVPVPRWLSAGGAWGWRLVGLLAALYAILRIGSYLRLAVLPVLLALLISTLLMPIALRLRAARIPAALAGAMAIIFGLTILTGLGTLVGFGVSGELENLETSLVTGYRQFVQWVAGLVGIPAPELRSWVEQHLDELRASAGSIASAAANRLLNVVEGLSVLLLALVFTWFFTWSGDKMFEAGVRLLPPKRQEPTRELGGRIWRTVGAYMRGMFVIATADALLLGLGLWVIDMPLIAPLMLLIFLGALVPFVGPIVAGAAAAFIGFAHGGVSLATLAVLVSVAVQQIEGNLLQPFIMGKAVQLPPALILFAVTSGAVIAGVAGIFLAVPVAASLATAFEFARERDVL